MVDIPPQQSKLLTSASLKRLMSARAAIVKPHPSLLSLFHLSRKEKLCNSDSWGAVTEIALCPVNTVCRHIGRGKKKTKPFFFSLDERRRVTWPGSHLYHSCCLATLCLLLSLVTCLRQNTGGTDSPGRRTPERVPPQGRSSPHHSLTMIGSCFRSQMELRLCCVLNLLRGFHISVKFSKGEQKIPVKQSAAWHTV